MIPFEAVALVPAFFFSLGAIFTRQGLEGSTPHTGSLVVLLINFVGFSLALVAVDFSRLTPSWYWVAFVGAGFASPALSLLFMFRSIHHIGAAPTNSIVNTHVFFGPSLAFFLVGERPPPVVWAGIVLVVAGVYSISGGGGIRGRGRYIALPLLSAACFGLAHNLRKIGLGGLDSLLFGGFLQGATAAAAAPVILKIASRGQPFVFARRSLRFFFLAGLAQAIAQLSLLYALRWGRVSLVSPILGTGPLFTLPLAHLMLGGIERLTSRIVAGACLIVLGVVLFTSLR